MSVECRRGSAVVVAEVTAITDRTWTSKERPATVYGLTRSVDVELVNFIKVICEQQNAYCRRRNFMVDRAWQLYTEHPSGIALHRLVDIRTFFLPFS